MYNCMRRYLISVNMKKFGMRSFHNTGQLMFKINNNFPSVRNFWANVTHKQFYCQTAIMNANDPKNTNTIISSDQQKLDEFLSNPENKKYFQILELEIDVLRHCAEIVPEKITERHWLTLLEMKAKSMRKKFLRFLWLNERSNENKKLKKEEKKAEWLAKKAEAEQAEDDNEFKYGLQYNSLFLRIYPRTISHVYNAKLIQAMMFEPKVVFDCSYENHMNIVENHNCAKQLTIAFTKNRLHINPLCLYFCNMNSNGRLLQNFKRNIPTLLDDDFPAIITSQSYLDLFPKDQLVYLTPHCKTDLIEYNSDMVYIIGSIVDKSDPKPLSLAKAKKEGLRMARLPIDKYLDWGPSSTKNLTLNHVMSILLDIRHTKDWKKALQHVPVRKLKQYRENILQRQIMKRNNSQYNSQFSSNFSIPERSQTKKLSNEINSFTFTNRRNK